MLSLTESSVLQADQDSCERRSEHQRLALGRRLRARILATHYGFSDSSFQEGCLGGPLQEGGFLGGSHIANDLT